MYCIKRALENTGILPVINVKNETVENTLLKAISETEIKSIEVTLRSDYSLTAIRRIKERRPDLLVGAGTVMNMQDLSAALSAGADYIVSPGLDADIVCRCIEKETAVIPGVSTPSEVMLALKLGCNTMKLFPAELSGGTRLLKLYEGAFSAVTFLPTGGITEENAPDYFACKNVLAVGGSFMAPEKALMSGDAAGISEICGRTICKFREIRGIQL